MFKGYFNNLEKNTSSSKCYMTYVQKIRLQWQKIKSIYTSGYWKKPWHIVWNLLFNLYWWEKNVLQLCLKTNTMHPTNTSKIWNSKPNIQYSTETAKDHFKKDTYKQIMHKQCLCNNRICEIWQLFCRKKGRRRKLIT